MVKYALFKDGVQISKTHSTKETVAIEAFEKGYVVTSSSDFGAITHRTELGFGCEIKEINNG